MKKTLIYGAAALLMLATSCKETLVQPTASNVVYTDTSYIASPETPQSRRVFIEEFTGVQCVNCPDGALTIDGILAAHPGQVSSISFHIGFTTTFNIPISGKSVLSENSIQDFRPDQGQVMKDAIWGSDIENKPNASFDRTPIAPSTAPSPIMVNQYTSWAGGYSQDLGLYPTTPVNIYVHSSYDEGNDQYNIIDTLKFTSTVTDTVALNIYVSEDSIIDAQELTPIDIDTAYVFNRVFRKSVTPPATGQIIKLTTSAGLVYVYRASLKIDKTNTKQSFWKPENMKVVTFVSVVPTTKNNNDKHVMQVQETKLMGN